MSLQLMYNSITCTFRYEYVLYKEPANLPIQPKEYHPIIMNTFLDLMRNKDKGIDQYLEDLNKQYGKLYVCPHGVFEVLKDLERKTGAYRKTLLRRFYNKSEEFSEWYIAKGDAPLSKSETCKVCDTLDDKLFEEGLWFISVEHTHDTDLQMSDKITYLYKGEEFTSTYGEYLEGVRPINYEGTINEY